MFARRPAFAAMISLLAGRMGKFGGPLAWGAIIVLIVLLAVLSFRWG